MTSGRAEIGGSSKDSINIRWHFGGLTSADTSVYQSSTNALRSSSSDGSQAAVRGYRVRYQAIGSSVVQYSQLLDPSTFEYDINNLHEDTNYDVCVVRIEDDQSVTRHGTAALTSVSGSPASTPTFVVSNGPSALLAAVCVKGTTATGSLSVSVGSTFAAFLTIGFVVALVFAAKWQHSRLLAKRAQSSGDSESGTDDRDGLEMMECVEKVRQAPDGHWHLSSPVLPIDRRLSVEYDNIPSSTVSAASRRSSSVAMGSQCFDAQPLHLAVYAVSEEHPEYGVLAGILSEEATSNCQCANDADLYGDAVGQWMAPQVNAFFSRRRDHGMVADEVWNEEEMSDWNSEVDDRWDSSDRERRLVGDGNTTDVRKELTVAVDYDNVMMLMNNECVQLIDSYELDNDGRNDVAS